MNNPEIKEQAEIKLEALPEFEIWKIRDETYGNIFNELSYDGEIQKEYIENKFDDIFYLSVSPQDIEKYADNQAIYEILKRYEHTAERHRLELMIFKFKELSEEKRQEILERLKREYEWIEIKLDDSKYWYVVWYFGWSQWRWNSSYMEEIKKIYPVKELK